MSEKETNHFLTKELLSELYENHQKELVVYAYSILRNMDDAKETVHDLFFSLLSKISDKKIKDISLRAFLFVSVKNRALTMLRSTTRNMNLSDTHTDHRQNISAIDDRLALDDVYDYVNRRFSDTARDVFFLRIVHGLTWQEIADVTKLSLSKVYRTFDASTSELAENFHDFL